MSEDYTPEDSALAQARDALAHFAVVMDAGTRYLPTAFGDSEDTHIATDAVSALSVVAGAMALVLQQRIDANDIASL